MDCKKSEFLGRCRIEATTRLISSPPCTHPTIRILPPTTHPQIHVYTYIHKHISLSLNDITTHTHKTPPTYFRPPRSPLYA